MLELTYPGVRYLHELATASVKATGKYPVSTIVRTAEEDLEDENDDSYDSFSTLDEPPAAPLHSPKGDKILLKVKPSKGGRPNHSSSYSLLYSSQTT